MHKRIVPFVLAALLVACSSALFATPLDNYIKAPDANFKYGPVPAKVITGDAFTAKVWKMTSQSWRSPAEVDRTLWEHWLTIIEPKEVKYTKAMIFIDGGSNGGDDPPNVNDIMGSISTVTGSIIADLKMIPNQPLKFADEKDERYKEKGRGEDELIAYTWDKCMVTGDTNWPARLPMTKAVVRAMDVVQAQFPKIDGFFVVGGSKRGWTTWTTAAVDPRVVAIAPAVIDVLNVELSMQHHHDVYGYWSDAVENYTDLKIMDRLHTPEFRKLMRVVDPAVYINRYTMPKFIVCSTGDQFFLPDSSQYYFDALKGEKYLRYVPNTDHGLDMQAYFDMTAFYQAVLDNTPRPKFSWAKEPDGTLRIRTETKPAAVRLWQATNPNARVFRLDKIGPAWTSAVLNPENDGEYVAKLAKPAQGWTAFMAELEYPGNGAFPLHFTTEVSVVPDTVPFRTPGGSGSIKIVGEGKDAITQVELTGDRYQMGYWYGRLLAEHISAACAKLLPMATEEQFNQAIDGMWNSDFFDTMMWELELHGVADGCADAGHHEVTYRMMQKALCAGDISEYGCSLFAAWGKATVGGETYQMRNLDWSMDTGLQDHPVVAIYNPTDGGKRHAVVGFAGMLGAGVGGMNEAGLGLSEIQGGFGDKETLKGIPFPVLLRDILYYDTTLDQTLDRMKKAVRTNEYHYAIADSAAPDPKARLLFTSNSRFDVFTDQQICTKHPKVNPTPFYEKLDNVVYWKNHNGSGNKLLYDAIKERYGAIDGPKAIEIARAAGVDSTLVSIIYHNSGKEMWVAYAEGLSPAHKQEYVHIDLK